MEIIKGLLIFFNSRKLRKLIKIWEHLETIWKFEEKTKENFKNLRTCSIFWKFREFDKFCENLKKNCGKRFFYKLENFEKNLRTF